LTKSQIILVGVAVFGTFLLYRYGRTTPETIKEPVAQQVRNQSSSTKLSFDGMLAMSKKRLSPSLLSKVEVAEKEILAEGITEKKILLYKQLAALWMDSAGVFIPFAKYTAEAAKLENSEKSLTFAAQLILEEALLVEDKPLQTWMAVEARGLFEKALQLHPHNDSAAIGLGSCFFFGAASPDEPPMKGVMMIREAAERNPTNAYAQRMLGIGAAVSGQTEKAAERFKSVIQLEPDNMDIILRLAGLYEQTGNKNEAKRWYEELVKVVKRLERSKKFNPGPEMIRQLEEHIKTLEK
jgi:tetratricopeptide (TPR) repeat protein